MKRLLDIAGSIFGLVFFSPAMLVGSFLVWREDKHNPFYTQMRVGKDGKLFKIYKIRSMVIDADKGHDNWTLQNDSRVLKIGKFLRSSNIDELPQFWNVLKGDMSLVGPRPETPEHNEKFSSEIPGYAKRKRVKPGLTGLSQVMGYRGDTCMYKRAALDNLYIKKHNPLMDIWIMLRTFATTKGAC